MGKRIYVSRKCPGCLLETLVRKDAFGKFCRSCRAKENSKNRNPKDILGKKFGMLLVISFSHTQRHSFWKCLCDCGKEKIVDGSKLRNGHTKSCGCLAKRQNGQSTGNTYSSWRAMKQRCEDESVPHYSRYGAKGIKVCPEWHSFDTFYKDMGERPKDMTLDRIDSKGGYNKANCQWSTPKQQARNVDRGCWIEGFGQKLRLVEWSERTGIASSTLRKRLTSGWNAEDILTKKVRKYAVSKR